MPKKSRIDAPGAFHSVSKNQRQKRLVAISLKID
jgi:hypothetical protein